MARDNLAIFSYVYNNGDEFLALFVVSCFNLYALKKLSRVEVES